MLPPLALYIHWPFCLSKCPYCDFNSHVNEKISSAQAVARMAGPVARSAEGSPNIIVAERTAQDIYVEALLKELRHWHERIVSRPLTSIFFGGGTPSLLAPAAVEKLLTTAQKLFGFAPDIEITLEANPTSSEAQKFRDFAGVGVNRLSIGVQALDDASLKSLGREHTVDEALRAIDMAQRAVLRMSFDLIYARKGQTLDGWERELKKALSLGTSHLSLYQLTIEPGTVFAQKTAVGETFTVDDETADAMYELTQELCAASGLPAYEVSNHARLGQESRHNLSYWHYDEYIGIGAGAHGRVRLDNGVYATAMLRPPQMWLNAVHAHGIGAETRTLLSLADQQLEHFMMNLRLSSGISKSAWHQRYGTPLDQFIVQHAKQNCIKEGLCFENEVAFGATPAGMRVLTSLTASLVH